ncbi:MAG: glycosyltransferase [Acidobacteriia bacterium]|nr:glycosyltransferase [Terriglobia bacterium]
MANDFPYPPHHGAAVDIWGRILNLKRLGFTLDLIATVKSGPTQADIDAVQAVVSHLWILERDVRLSASLSLDPFQVRSRRALKQVTLAEKYDAVLLESEHVGPILENVRLQAKARILRSQNDEARYFRELSKSSRNWKERLFYKLEAVRFDKYSPALRAKCDLLWFISDWERTLHLRKSPTDVSKAVFLPPDPGSKIGSYAAFGKEVLFVGTLAVSLNVNALQWYVDHIHPRLSKLEGYSLTIAGRTGGVPIPALIKMVERYTNISFCPDPQDLSDLYSRAAVFVNPVLRGAGLKVKTINALQAGVAVVTTSIGMEGTGLVNGTHLLVADSVGEFAGSVERLLTDRSLAAKLVCSAQSFFAEEYNQERNIEQSLSAVLSIRPGDHQ